MTKRIKKTLNTALHHFPLLLAALALVACTACGGRTSTALAETSLKEVSTQASELAEEYYSSILENLSPGSYYAILNTITDGPPLMAVTDKVDKDGLTSDCTIYAISRGEVMKLGDYLSGGSAYPICCLGDSVYVSSPHSVQRYVLDPDAGTSTLTEDASQSFETDGSSTYSYNGISGAGAESRLRELMVYVGSQNALRFENRID